MTLTRSLSHAAALSLCLPVLARANPSPSSTPSPSSSPSPTSLVAKGLFLQGPGGVPGLVVSSMSINASLPLLGVGLVTLVLSLCFCCYLWKLRRDARSERGYCQLKYSPRSKKMKNDVCPVCLEEFQQAENLAVSRCRHGFHTKCLQQWLDQHNTCPMCKAQVALGQAGERTGLITTSNV